MTQVKICGVRRVEHALAAAEAGADMLGFVFAPSRRRIEPESARAIIRQVRAVYPRVRMVGLFVNERPDTMERVAAEAEVDMIQLSGDEPDAVARALSLPVIRAVHVHPGTDRAALAERIERAPGDVVLLDTGKIGVYGGTGERFDWDAIPRVTRPIILAGGLTAENVEEAVRVVRPWGVDVSSGVERDGVKDEALIRRFTLAAKQVHAV